MTLAVTLLEALSCNVGKIGVNYKMPIRNMKRKKMRCKNVYMNLQVEGQVVRELISQNAEAIDVRRKR